MSQSLLSDLDTSWHEPFHNRHVDPEKAKCPTNDGESTPLEEELSSQTEGCHLATNALLSPGERLHLAAVKVQAAVKFTRLQRLTRRARWATKKLIVFVLSQVGLTCLVVLYAIAGGFIFMTLESNTSPVNYTEAEPTSFIDNLTATFNLSIQQHGSHYAERMWNNTESYNVLYPSIWKSDTQQELELFAWQVYYQALRDSGVIEIEDDEVTTSSYRPSKQEIPSSKQSSQDNPEIREWTYPRALLFAVTVITTIGYGDTVPTTLGAKLVCMLYATIGIPMTLLCLANIGSLMASVYKFTWKHVSHMTLVIIRSPARSDPKPETSKVRVPIVVSLATMIGYIFGGAVIFSMWEGWSYIDGSYFCFVTLSTIGFGDFVPGKNADTFTSNSKRVVCALYLLFGLALLSMVFQLIQDSVLVIVSRYASLLGLSKSKIEKDIEDSADNEKPLGNRSDDANKDAPKLAGEKNIDEKSLAYPIQECTDPSLSGETYQRFLDVAKMVSKHQQQSISPVPETKKKQLKVTYKLHPVSKERTSKQGYNKVNRV